MIFKGFHFIKEFCIINSLFRHSFSYTMEYEYNKIANNFITYVIKTKTGHSVCV